MWLYFIYDRNIAFPHRSAWDANTNMWHSVIEVHSIEHAQEIEIPALQWVFKQMMRINNCVPPHNSMGQAILLYRALHLLHFEAAGAGVRQQLLHQIKNQPLNAYDVQRIWWAFYGSAEWSEWLGEILYNLARHDVYNHHREGSFILYFLEVEMLQLSQAEQEEIRRTYLHYLHMTPTPGPGMSSKAWMALGTAWGVVSCAPLALKTRQEREMVE